MRNVILVIAFYLLFAGLAYSSSALDKDCSSACAKMCGENCTCCGPDGCDKALCADCCGDAGCCVAVEAVSCCSGNCTCCGPDGCDKALCADCCGDKCCCMYEEAGCDMETCRSGECEGCSDSSCFKDSDSSETCCHTSGESTRCA